MNTDRIAQLLNSIATGENAFSGRAILLDDPESCWIVLGRIVYRRVFSLMS